MGLNRSWWRGAFATCALAVLLLSLLPGGADLPSTGWDKTNHALAFFVLALLGFRAFAGRASAVLAGLLAYGALIELLQSFTSYRFAEWGDLLGDALGLLLAWTLMQLSAFARRRRRGASGGR